MTEIDQSFRHQLFAQHVTTSLWLLHKLSTSLDQSECSILILAASYIGLNP